MKASKRSGLVITVIAVVLLLAITLGIWLYSTRNTSTQEVVIIPTSPTIKTTEVGANFTSPTSIAALPDNTSPLLFVTEREGTIRSFDATDPFVKHETFLDIKDKVSAGGEMGLLGLAFHPDYSENGFFFINYIDNNKNTVVARYHAPERAQAADPASEKIILTLPQPYENHNGGDLAFDANGYLYISTGDGGRAGDPDNRAQDKNSLLGKILRLDINTDDSYVIPSNNPFAGQADSRPEIWAYGLRNPWRMSFDAKTHDLYIADVGQGNMEEVDFQPANSKGGENYGWRCYEGTRPYNTENCGNASSYQAPIVEYDHSGGRCSITGGYVYRGTTQPALEGKYFYGDFCSGEIFYAAKELGGWSQTRALETSYSISTFGQGSDGELYVADFEAGKIYQLQAVAQ